MRMRTKDDLISRQSAIDALGEKPLVWDDLSDFDLGKAAQWSDDVDAIKALPSAQPRWIPVTERLPEEDTEVIVSCTDDSGDSEFSYTTTGWHYKGIWVVDNERSFFVKAWTPLPEPWKGE